MNSLLKFLLSLLFISCFVSLFSQTTSFSFVSIDKKKGLPDNSIYNIFQDNKGFVWLCTGKGLVRYDGYDFKLFQYRDNSTGVSSYRATHVMQDNSGKLWISTSDKGISVYNPEDETLIHYFHEDNKPGSLSNNNVHYCYQDSKDRIWVCSLGAGLDLFNAESGTFRHFMNGDNTNSFPNSHITSIIEDRYGKMWVACDGNYICRLDPQTSKIERFQTRFQGINLGGYFKKLYFTSPDLLWIVTDGTGLYSLDIKKYEFKRYFQDFRDGSLNSNNLKGMLPDYEGKMLIISDGGGLNIFDKKTETFSQVTYDLNSRNGISSNALYSILKDKENNIWMGTYKAGLLLLKENTRTINVVTQKSDQKGLCNKSVLSILKDKDGFIWYGTDGGGLTSYNPEDGIYKCYQYQPNDPNSISNNVVKAILEDKEGIFWIATFNGGLNRFDKKTGIFKHYQYNPNVSQSISSNVSWSLLEDREGKIWIGNFSTGLDYFDKSTEKFTHIEQDYSQTNTLSHVQVSSLVQEASGNIWVGSLYGLNYLNYKSLKCQRFYHDVQNPNSISDDLITCLFYDSKKRLWIGTDNGGINLMIKPGEFKTYGTKGELPSLAIQSIQEDIKGNLWMSTKNGLVKFNPESETFYIMDEVDDLLSNEFNWNSSYADKDGNLYFGSIDGVCIFNPADINFQKSFPKLVFTNVKVFNNALETGKSYHGRVLLKKSVSYGGKLTLTAKENAFTIDFAAIEFSKPDKIKYQYKLKGFDQDWVTTDALHRNATYTNLSGGNYEFLLKSTNAAGIWNDDVISLQITIIPPFYKQWWFKLLMIAAVAAVLWSVFKRNIEKHKREIREEALKREKELIEKRNEELKSEIASNTILLLNKNESLEQIKSKLEELEPGSDANIKVKELISMVDHQMEVDVYWEQFQYNFDQVYQNLLTRLKEKYPDLTRSNLKLCAYLRLNMSSKEIASLMNITPSGIDKARNRLRKKLDIHPNEDLSEFLFNF